MPLALLMGAHHSFLETSHHSKHVSFKLLREFSNFALVHFSLSADKAMLLSHGRRFNLLRVIQIKTRVPVSSKRFGQVESRKLPFLPQKSKPDNSSYQV